MLLLSFIQEKTKQHGEHQRGKNNKILTFPMKTKLLLQPAKIGTQEHADAFQIVVDRGT